MELIEVILLKENLNRAYKKLVSNKGAGGVDSDHYARQQPGVFMPYFNGREVSR